MLEIGHGFSQGEEAMAKGSERFMAEGTPGPGTEGARVVDTRVLYNRLVGTLLGLKAPGIAPEQKEIIAREIADNVIELHERKVFTGNPNIQSYFRDNVFNNDPDSHLLSEKLVEGIEKQLETDNPNQQSIQEQLQLAGLLDINNQPDLARRLETVSGRINQQDPTPTTEAGGGQPPSGDGGDRPTALNPDQSSGGNISSWDVLNDQEKEGLAQVLRPDQLEQIKNFNPATFNRWYPGFVARQQATQEALAVTRSQERTEPQQPAQSPIRNLSMEDLNLFINATGTTVEGLQALIKEKGEDPVLGQLRLRVEQLRNQPTSEQQARMKAEERAITIEQLKDQREDLKNLPENTDDEKRLKLFRKMRIEDELRVLSGGEGPPEPPLDKTLEYESSPERGRQIAERIFELEGLRAAGKLEKVDWGELDDLYLKHEIHIEAVRRVSLRVKPSEPKQQKQTIQEFRQVNPEAFKGVGKTVCEWIMGYEEGTITDWNEFKKEVDVYFDEAKKSGMLQTLDRTLKAVWREVRQGINRGENSEEIMARAEQRIQGALNNEVNLYFAKRHTDPNISRLAFIDPQTNKLTKDTQTNRIRGIWDLYAQLARERFADVISRQDREGVTQANYLDNEFRLLLPEEDLQRETFWKATHGWYIEVYAQTPEEFIIAADSYISMLQSISADPQHVLEQARQFVEVLSKSDGAQRLLHDEEWAEKVLGKEKGSDFLNRLKLGIEARVGVFGADDANERYNGENYGAYLDFTNKDGKGPDRYLELARMYGARVAAALWKFDKDPTVEILFATYGSRGQLAKMSIAQRDRLTGQGIFNQRYNMLIEEMMGVHIRNMDDVDKVTQFMPDRTFIQFFDGLYRYDPNRKQKDYGDANIKARNFIKDIPEEKLTLEQQQSKRNGIARLGRIQLELRDGKVLSSADQRFYDRAYAEAKKAVDIAFQVYGAFGEKSKRAGGVFKTAEKIDDEGKRHRYFIPIHWAEKYIQFSVTMTKVKYADDAEVWNERYGYKKWNDATTQKIKEENKKRGESEWANFKAQYRTAKANETRDKNIIVLQQDGYEAMVVDDNGQQMILKRPKEDPNAPDELARDAQGNIIPKPEEVAVDFYTATHHPYGDWSGHTYWSYQEEHRHLLLSPNMFDQAREIKKGTLRWEDADPVAVQLLILDPTLLRVRRFEKGFEDRERKLTMAAVEDSYQTHWEISRELYREFWPKYGTPAEKIGIYYGLQDYGGYRKTLESMRARIAEDPERFARRGRRLLPDLHNPVATLSEYLGQGSQGALAAIRMMGYPMYRLAGTFALDKFRVNAEVGGKMYGALIGFKDKDGNYKEGLLLKLTNNSDKLVAIIGKIPHPGKKWGNAKDQNEFCYGLMDSLGRLQVYEQLFTVMETDTRNASGALDLRNIDVLIDGDQINAEIASMIAALPPIVWVSEKQGKDITRDDLAKRISTIDKLLAGTEQRYNERFNKSDIDESRSPNTGSGRHSARIFHDTFGELLMDEEKRDATDKLPSRTGPELYPGEKLPYSRIEDKIIIAAPRLFTNPIETKETIWGFIFGKFVPT